MSVEIDWTKASWFIPIQAVDSDAESNFSIPILKKCFYFSTYWITCKCLQLCRTISVTHTHTPPHTHRFSSSGSLLCNEGGGPVGALPPLVGETATCLEFNYYPSLLSFCSWAAWGLLVTWSLFFWIVDLGIFSILSCLKSTPWYVCSECA